MWKDSKEFMDAEKQVHEMTRTIKINKTLLKKDPNNSQYSDENRSLQEKVQEIKKEFPELFI